MGPNMTPAVVPLWLLVALETSGERLGYLQESQCSLADQIRAFQTLLADITTAQNVLHSKLDSIQASHREIQAAQQACQTKLDAVEGKLNIPTGDEQP